MMETSIQPHLNLPTGSFVDNTEGKTRLRVLCEGLVFTEAEVIS